MEGTLRKRTEGFSQELREERDPGEVFDLKPPEVEEEIPLLARDLLTVSGRGKPVGRDLVDEADLVKAGAHPLVGEEETIHLDVCAQFLREFALETCLGCFHGFQTTPGKEPPGAVEEWVQEDVASGTDDGGDSDLEQTFREIEGEDDGPPSCLGSGGDSGRARENWEERYPFESDGKGRGGG